MLTDGEYVLVIRTGPGTPMGETRRRDWIPELQRSAYAPQ